jgi:hypothetical protein
VPVPLGDAYSVIGVAADATLGDTKVPSTPNEPPANITVQIAIKNLLIESNFDN